MKFLLDEQSMNEFHGTLRVFSSAEPVVKACLNLLVEWIEPLRIGERDEG